MIPIMAVVTFNHLLMEGTTEAPWVYRLGSQWKLTEDARAVLSYPRRRDWITAIHGRWGVHIEQIKQNWREYKFQSCIITTHNT